MQPGVTLKTWQAPGYGPHPSPAGHPQTVQQRQVLSCPNVRSFGPSRLSWQALTSRVKRATSSTAPLVVSGSVNGQGRPETNAVPSVTSNDDSSQQQQQQQRQQQQQQIEEHDLWTARPEPPFVGHKRQLAGLLLGVMLEFSLTGAILWAPVLGALLAILANPSPATIQRRQEAAVAAAVARARQEAASKVAVTPLESVEWLNRMLGAMWGPYLVPFVLKQQLASWQDNVNHAAPRGWEVDIVDCQLGSSSPQLSSYQAFADPATGALSAVDCHMVMDSADVKVVVKGKGPLGSFVARVSGVHVEGDMRITPVVDQRMLLFAFKAPPSVNVKLSLTGPIRGAGVDLSQLDFIQNMLAAQIGETLVEPRRGAISLDYDIQVQEAVFTTVKLSLEKVIGLPKSLTSSRTPPQLQVTVMQTTTRLTQYSGTVVLQPGDRVARWQEVLEIELPGKDGIFKLEVRDISSGRSSGLLGSVLLWVAAAQDGSTLFWSHSRSGTPLAQRWGPTDKPWRVSLPLFGGRARAAELQLGVAVEPWTYKQPLEQMLFRSSGPHTLVLQVVQARGLAPGRAAGLLPNPYVRLQYDQVLQSSSTWYSTSTPVWGEAFVFEENPSMLTRRVRVELWSSSTPLQQRLQQLSRSIGSSSSSPAASGGSWIVAAGPAGGAGGATGTPRGSNVDGTAGSKGGALARPDVNLGSVMVNLDMVTETAIQDRWYPLLGGGPGEVRLRCALVPGLLPESWSPAGGSGSPHPLLDSPVSSPVSSWEDASTGSRGGGSGEVEEVLGFMEGSLLGSSTSSLLVEVITSRLYLPLSSMDSEDETQALYQVTYRGATSLIQLGGKDTTSPARVTPSRALFPLASNLSSSSRAIAVSSSSSPGGTGRSGGPVDQSNQSVAAPLTKSPTDISSYAVDVPEFADGDTPGGDTYSSSVTTPIGTSSSSRSSRGGQGAAGSGQQRDEAHMLVVRCFDPEVSWQEDIGAVAVDVERWLGAGGDSWEGWVQLDKDGGHLLLRLSYLAASEPGDILPPPRRDALLSATSGAEGADSSSGRSEGSSGSRSAGGGGDSRRGSEEEGEGDRMDLSLVDLLQKGVSDVKGQAADLTHQLESLTADTASNLQHWWSDTQHSLTQSLASPATWSNWNPFAKPSQQQEQQQGQKEQKEEGGSDSSKQERAQEGAPAAAGDAPPGSSNSSSSGTESGQRGRASGAAAAHVPSSIDLQHFAAALGWTGSAKSRSNSPEPSEAAATAHAAAEQQLQLPDPQLRQQQDAGQLPQPGSKDAGPGGPTSSNSSSGGSGSRGQGQLSSSSEQAPAAAAVTSVVDVKDTGAPKSSSSSSSSSSSCSSSVASKPAAQGQSSSSSGRQVIVARPSLGPDQATAAAGAAAHSQQTVAPNRPTPGAPVPQPQQQQQQQQQSRAQQGQLTGGQPPPRMPLSSHPLPATDDDEEEELQPTPSQGNVPAAASPRAPADAASLQAAGSGPGARQQTQQPEQQQGGRARSME